jgi:hypothetical protein
VNEFESAGVLYGDINDYIERIWSEERYLEATNAFKDAVVIQDVSARKSVVHTDYTRLKYTLLEKDKTILTHCPDQITSEWVLCYSEKNFRVKGTEFYEIVDGKLFPMNADIYHKENGRFYVGFRRENGKFKVYEKSDLIHVYPNGAIEGVEPGRHIYNVDLYEDISGMYYPVLDDPDAIYVRRNDGKVERVTFTEQGSEGRVVDSQRGGPSV